MKREELIESLTRRMGWNGDWSEFADNDEELMRESLRHLTDPTRITLQLPTYAAGDPKAGEVVNIGDRVFFGYGPPGTVETYVYGEDGIGIQCEFRCSVERRYRWFYSTAAARDAAMKAAEEAAK